MSKYHMLKIYIKHNKCNFIIPLISNKIIINKMAQKCLFTYCYFFFIWWSPFIPSRNLDEVFTYNHIWL